MGIGIRVFIFDNENLVKITYAKFNRLLNCDIQERIPEYAGQRIKVALVYIELEQRKPIGIAQIDCEYFTVDKNGRFDENEWKEKLRNALKTLPFPLFEEIPSNVIDSSAHFAKKTFQNKFLWTPKIKDIQKIEAEIFKP